MVGGGALHLSAARLRWALQTGYWPIKTACVTARKAYRHAVLALKYVWCANCPRGDYLALGLVQIYSLKFVCGLAAEGP